MLNAELVQQFQNIHGQQLSGSLIVDYANRRISFFFKEGELFLLDFNEDKETLLVTQYRDYHKIGAEIEAVVLQIHQTGGAKVQDFLLGQQLVSQEEASQVTRTLVEDCLCNVFGSPSTQIAFDPTATEDQFDLDFSAVKLRIQVELLLEMVQARVAERDAVKMEINDWSIIYNLAEGAPNAESLNEMEQNVLHFVDGRKSVEDLATSIRESSLNTACYLVSLANQGFVRKARHSTRLRLQAVDKNEIPAQPQQQEVAVAAGQAPMPVSATQTTTQMPAERVQPQSFAPVYAESAPKSKAPMIVLAVVLVVVASLAALVYFSKEKRGLYQEQLAELRSVILAGDWSAASELGPVVYQQASFDPILLEGFESYVEEVNTQLMERVDSLKEKLSSYEYDSVRSELSLLPDSRFGENNVFALETLDAIDDFREALTNHERQSAEQAVELEADVEADLAAGQVQKVVRIIETEPAVITSRARIALAAWRNRFIDEAGTPSMPLVQRRSLLEQVKEALPSESDLASIRRIESEIATYDQRLKASLQSLSDKVAAGDYAGTKTEIAGLLAIAIGGDYEAGYKRLQEQAAAIEMRVDRLWNEGLNIAKHGRDQQLIASVRKRIASELKLSLLSRASALKGLDNCLQALAVAVKEPTIQLEMASFESSLASGAIPGEFRAIIADRQSGLKAEEERYERDYQDIIAQRSQLGIEQCVANLTAFIARSEVQRGAVVPRVKATIADWQGEISERAEIRKQLSAAILADEPEEVDRIAKVLNLPRLPLAVMTEPAGAAVMKRGRRLGVTPMVIEDISPERLSHVYQVQVPGYKPHEFKATDATGGWKLFTKLVREAKKTLTIGGPITSEPTVVEDTIWLAGTSNMASIDPSGKIVQYAIADGIVTQPLREPVYAPVTVQDGMVFLGTRDELLVRLHNGKLTREPLRGTTNFGTLRFVNPNVLDREMFVIAGRDGRLLASDPGQSRLIWQSDTGAAFVAAPVLVGDVVYAVRNNGVMDGYQVDDGLSISSQRLIDENVLSANWYGGKLVALSEQSRLTWSSGGAVETTGLPGEAILASENAIVASDWRVHVFNGESWVALGRVHRDDKQITAITKWGEQAVVIKGQELIVLGNRSFSLTTDSDFLKPLVVGDDLVVVTTDGTIRVFAP